MSERHEPGYMPWDRTGNPLLVHSSLGKARPTNYTLPHEGFAYGNLTPQDPEHVDDLIHNWKYHQNTSNPNINKHKDLIKTNKQCVRSLLHTAKDFYNFRKTATSFKQPKQGCKVINIKLPQEDFVYGLPTKCQEPIKLLIANQYGYQDKKMREMFYQNQTLQNQNTKRNLSFYKTKGFQMQRKSAMAKLSKMQNQKKKQSEQWKLNKFLDVTHRVEDRRGNNVRPFSANTKMSQVNESSVAGSGFG